MESLLENMDDNEKILEDMEKPWEQKLKEEKEKNLANKIERGEITQEQADQKQEEEQVKEEIKDSVEENFDSLNDAMGDANASRKDSGTRESFSSIMRSKRRNTEISKHNKTAPHFTNLHEDP